MAMGEQGTGGRSGEQDGSGDGEAARRELEESNASELMADEMLANAMAHGEQVDLERRHEESLEAAAELDPPAAEGGDPGRR
jgi:hypothetical protein